MSSTQVEASQRFYYPELDGLRFVAFLLVFIHNANPILKGTFLEKFSEYSWFGVDLFFCLSGFGPIARDPQIKMRVISR